MIIIVTDPLCSICSLEHITHSIKTSKHRYDIHTHRHTHSIIIIYLSTKQRLLEMRTKDFSVIKLCERNPLRLQCMYRLTCTVTFNLVGFMCTQLWSVSLPMHIKFLVSDTQNRHIHVHNVVVFVALQGWMHLTSLLEDDPFCLFCIHFRILSCSLPDSSLPENINKHRYTLCIWFCCIAFHISFQVLPAVKP